MHKLKLFIENFLVYGLGSIINKIIPLIMIPIITRIMPNTFYFGISDLSNTVIQFGSYLAVLGMYDAMYRMFFERDDEEYKKKICSTALLFTLFTSLVVFILMFLGRNLIAQYFFGNKKYAYLIYITAIATLVGATNNIISAPTRMQNKRKIFLITNTISPLLSYSIAIPLLLQGHYIIALPISTVISGITLEISFGVMNHRWFNLKSVDVNLLKQLLIIAIPLFPNFLIYWIFNSCDKLMITNILNAGAAGVYSIGSKLGHVSQLIYTAFAGGWQYFAFSTMKEDNQVSSNSMIFEYLGIISFIATSFVCACSYLIYNILFEGDYVSGYIVSPYLFFTPLLQMLFQIACNQFIIIKKTWPNMFILSIGAILNIIINIVLIPVLGIEGAAIATLMGYIVSVIVCVIVLCKMNLMIISNHFLFASIFMIFFMFIWRLFFKKNTIMGTCAALLLTVFFVFLYKKDLKKLIQVIHKK